MILCLFSSACGGDSSSSVRITAAREGSNYSAMAEVIGTVLHEDDPSLSYTVIESSGSEENIRSVSAGKNSLGIAQSDTLSDAFQGVGMFNGEKAIRNIRAIAALYPEACQIVTRADSNYETVNDLRAGTISVGDSGSGTEQNAFHILLAYGLSETTVTTVNMSTAEACEAMKNGQINAFFYTSGAPAKMITELAEEIEIRLLPIDGPERDALLREYPYFMEYTIPAGVYQGLDEDLDTISVQSVLITSNKESEDFIYQVTRAIYEHDDKIRGAVKFPFTFNPNASSANIPIPFHSGAGQYYQEVGISVESQ